MVIFMRQILILVVNYMFFGIASLVYSLTLSSSMIRETIVPVNACSFVCRYFVVIHHELVSLPGGLYFCP